VKKKNSSVSQPHFEETFYPEQRGKPAFNFSKEEPERRGLSSQSQRAPAPADPQLADLRARE
jgi:hypothetical protein